MTALSSLPERVRRKAVLERDLARLRRESGDALRSVRDGDGPTALFVSLTEFVYQLKLEGMLGKALQLAGWKPIVLVQDDSWVPRKYLAAFGIESFATLAPYLDDAARAEAAAAAREIIGAKPALADVRDLTFHGARIGRNILATVSRALHEGAVDLDDPRARAELERLLPRTLEATIAAERLLADLEPTLMLFLERNYAAEAPISDVALVQGLDVVQYVSGPQDDTLIFKRFTRETRREHPRSLSEESWLRVRELPWTPERDAELDDEFAKRYGNAWALSRRIQSWTEDRPCLLYTSPSPRDS